MIFEEHFTLLASRQSLL